MKFKNILFLGFLAFPFFTHATANPTTGLIDNIGAWVGNLIPITIALALLFFLWGLVMFIKNSGDSAAREEGKQKMFWGVVALFVMVSVWGLVTFLGKTLGIESGGSLTPPTIGRSI